MAFCRHLKALLWKNGLLWRRRLGGSICEILFPVFLIGLVAMLRGLVTNKDYDEQTHVTGGYAYASDPTFTAELENIFVYPDFQLNNVYVTYQCTYWGIVGEENDRRYRLGNMTETILQTAGINLTFKSFKDDKELKDYISGAEYQKDDDTDCMYFAIGMPQSGQDNNWDWKIYMSARFPDNIPDTKFDQTSTNPNPDSFDKYSHKGFTFLQNILAKFTLSEVKDDVEPLFGANIGAVTIQGKTKAYTKDEFMDGIGPSLSLFFLLIFLAPKYRLISFIVQEKSSRAREGMKIMGLKDSPYWISWFIYYTSICIVISLICAIILVAFVFKNSSYLYMFLFSFLYGMSIFSYSLLICTFLQRPRVASILSTLIHFMTYLSVIPFADYGVVKGAKTFASILPNNAMALCVDAMAALEGMGKGLNADSLTYEVHNYEVIIAFQSWIIMFFVFGLLALYLDNVLPKEYGIKQPLYFFLTPKYWCGDGAHGHNEANEHQRLLDSEDDQLNGGHKDFEAVPPALRELEKTDDCMKVRHLKKVYGNGKVAVKDVSLTMYNSQIFALLGHNGAGKTTTISILTGMFPSSGGTASCFGLDMFRDLNDLRKNLGVCPQFDILFDLLTPREHLKLFCMFKGVDPSTMDEEIEKTLRDVDLASKSNAYSKTLSGGQKRKLSVGIAMVGGSRLVLLDEPTSGMDLTARRKIWDMLKNNKQNRILILTTHFMDEADILGDRIAIMAGGLIKCCGSSLFLKKRFGVGYNLVLAKENKDPNPEIDKFIMDKIPTAIKLSEVSSEVTYQIPQTESDKFEDFFTDLDASMKTLKIKSYGVGVTTLEEVFLRVGRDEDETDEERRKSIKEVRRSIQMAKSGHDDEEEEKDGTIGGSINDSDDGSPKNVDEYSIAENSVQDTFWLHFGALTIKRMLVSFRQPKTFLLEILIPIILIISGLALSNSPFFSDPPYIDLDMSWFPSEQTLYYQDISTPVVQADNDKFHNYFKKSGTRWSGRVNEMDAAGADLNATLQDFENKVFAEGGYDEQIKNSGNYILHTLDSANNNYQVIAFANSYGRDSSPTYIQHLYNAVLVVATGDDDFKFTTEVAAYPLTATAIAGAKAGSGSIVAFLFAIAFAMIPAGVASQIVNERETNVKHQQFISGADLSSYWLSNYVVDWFRSMISILVAIIFISVFSVDLPMAWVLFLIFALAIHPFTYATTFYFKKENVAQTMTILFHVFVGGFLAIAVLVLQSFDSTKDIGDTIRWLFKIVPSFSVIFGILQISTREIIARAYNIDSPDPPLSFNVAGGDALFLAIDIFFWWFVVWLCETGYIYALCCRRRDGVDQESLRKTEGLKIDSDVMAEEMRCMDLDPNSCSVLVKGLRKVYKGVGQQSVVAVRNTSFGLEYGECFALLGVNGAGKTTTFKSMTGDVIPSDGKIYIEGLDLAMKEEFTKARKLIGYCPQENAIFEGMTVAEHLWFYARIKGILPHMREPIIEKIMQEMDLEEFKKVQVQTLSGGNKRKLSVAMAMIGNPPIVFLDEPSTGMDPRAKRFMWTIISRISTLRKKSTVILTTHSMEEAEALCTKMGIMVNGRFKCYGSSQDIKDKFGTGYEVEIKIAWPTEEEAMQLAADNSVDKNIGVTDANVEDMLRQVKMDRLTQLEEFESILSDIQKDKSISVVSLYQWALLENSGLFIKEALERNTRDCKVLEHYNNFYKFRIERGDKTLGFFFGFMESLKKDVKFEEYAVSQTTLEQIFNAFALEQDIDEPGRPRRRSTVRK